MNILCETNPQITKIFVFKNKAQDQVWQSIEQSNCAGQRYLFFCSNYRGHYQVVNWEALPHNGQNGKAQKCQYQAPNCQKLATYQHTLKLGTVQVDKKWVCTNCKQILEQKDYDRH